MHLILAIEKEPCTLRNVLSNRASLAERGQRIVKLLLQGYDELEKLKITAVNATPSTIFISGDNERLTFADVT